MFEVTARPWPAANLNPGPTKQCGKVVVSIFDSMQPSPQKERYRQRTDEEIESIFRQFDLPADEPVAYRRTCAIPSHLARTSHVNQLGTDQFGVPIPMRHFLDFEKSVADLEGKIEELRRVSEGSAINITGEITRLTLVVEQQLREIYAKLTPWQKTQVARHPQRPKAKDYIKTLITEFTPLAGDRAFGDDPTVIGGIGRFNGRPVMILGTEKGSDTESRVKYNFGMARPEGYRKCRRLIELAGRFRLPIVSFVDTPGAFPGIDAEARGQAEAIARSIEACLEVPVPVVATIIGEGGSGGAVALAAGDCTLMLEHAIYSVISPEGCASILWRDANQAPTAAEALRLTASDLLDLHLIDSVIVEPLGGAHRDAAATISSVGEMLVEVLAQLASLEWRTLKVRRREKFLAMGNQAIVLSR